MNLFQRIARTLNVLLLVGFATVSVPAFQCALAQSTASPQPSAPPAPHANAASNNQAPTNPAEPQIDKAKIAQRLNHEIGFDLEATTAGWQHTLDRLDGELA